MLSIPLEIADLIATYVYESDLDKLHLCDHYRPVSPLQLAESWNRDSLCLKATSNSFRIAVDRLLFAELEIDTLSLQSVRRIKTLLASTSICPRIRSYSFLLHVYGKYMPNSKREPWVVYGTPADSISPSSIWRDFDWRTTMRIQASKQYDEEFMSIQSEDRSSIWTSSGLQEMLLWEIFRVHLKVMPYFSMVSKLTNLQRLCIGYPVPQDQETTPTHYSIKESMSAGIATILLNPPQHLRFLGIHGATLTDTQDLVNFLLESGSSVTLPELQAFELYLSGETLKEMGRAINPRPGFHIHANGGKAVSDLLNLLPTTLESLEIDHCEVFYEDRLLVLHEFNPPLLQNLKQLRVERLVLSSKALLQLTTCQGQSFKSEPLNIQLCDISVFAPGLSWNDMFEIWAERQVRNEQEKHEFHFKMDGQCGYVDRARFTDQVLSGLAPDEQIHRRIITRHDLVQFSRVLGQAE